MYNQWASQGPSTSHSQTDIASSFPSLANMTFSELENFEKDNEEVKKMVEQSDIVKKQLQEKEDLMMTIRSLAEYNLSQEPELNRMKIQLSQTHEQAVEAFKEYDKNKILLDASPSKTSKDVQLALLQTETAKTEEECENFTSTFLSKEMEVDEFVEKYLERRKLSNMRRIKAEKMSDLIRNASSNTRAAPSNDQTSPFSQFPHANNIPPYASPSASYQPYNQGNYFSPPSHQFHPTQPPYPSAVFSGNQAFPQPSLF